MVCKKCNTRVTGVSTNCPNCGTAVTPASASTGETGSRPANQLLPPPGAPEEIQLEDEAVERLDVAVSPAPDPNETKPDVPALQRDAGAGSQPDVLALLAENPELLESGLSVHSDGPKTDGVGFHCEVGDIDLLARDGSGAFVVVMLARSTDGEGLVRDILQRIGWVRKNLADGQRVRGTVLLESAPPNLGYLAEAVSDSVAFKTYRVAVAFDDVTL